MRKSVLSAALAAVMLLSGCSGVSQEKYNSLLEENSKLKESSSSSESSSSETGTSETSTSEMNTSSSTESTTSSVSTADSANEPNSSSSGNTSIDINEMLENGEMVISPVTGAVWLFSEDTSSYLTSIGADPFASASDDEKVGYCYLDAIYFATDEKFADKYYLYLFWGDPNTGNTVGYCTVTHLFGEISIVNDTITWANEWEKFNNSNINQKYSDIIKDAEFNQIKDEFEMDGYKVNMTGEYEFSTVDNQFSEWNGKPVIKVAANIENVSSKYDYCMLYCTITDPNGETIDNLDAFFDDGIFMKQIEKGKPTKRYFVIPYTGDGEYRFEFSDIVSQKCVYKINITRP